MPAARKPRGGGGGTATRKRAAKKEAPPAEPEASEEETTEEEETGNGRKQRSSEPFPSGEELYNAKYVDGMTWQEIRDNIDERIRSPKGLSLIAGYVIENGLEDEHPEFSDLSELDDDALAEAVVEWHDNGQGWAVLAARTGLSAGEVRDLYEESGGENPGRVGGQRYGGGRSKAKSEEEEASGEGGDDAEEESKPARKRSAKAKPAAKPAASGGRRRSRRGNPSSED